MSLHPVLTKHPAIARTQARVDETRAAVDAVLVRDREALGQWEADAVAAARAGRPCPDRPSPTSHGARDALGRDLMNSQLVHNAALVDVAAEVEDELLGRQSEVLAEAAAHRDALALLGAELSALGGTADTLDRARGISPRGHLSYRPEPVDLLKALVTGTVWVAI